MNPDFTSSEKRADPCCGGDRTGDEQDAYRSALELHRSTRAQTLTMLQVLSQNQLDYQPAPEKWSVGEVLDHLILGQRLNLSYMAEVIGMKKGGQRPDLRLSFTDVDVSLGYIPKSLLPALETPFTILNMFLPTTIRDFMTSHRLVPAQNPHLTTPRRARPVHELRSDLISSFKEMETLLRSHAHLDYSEMVIRHPLLGNNSIAGLLRFLALHEWRHQSQIDDILTSPRFPKSNLNGAGVPHVE
jgi:hypothetical protein